MQDKKLLAVHDLTVQFRTLDGLVTAAEDVSFSIDKAEVIGIVGESGSGKSVTALSILRLIASPPGLITSGEIVLNGIDLLQLKERDMEKIRGNDVSMIFQEPMSALNPIHTCGRQITEPLILHKNMNKQEATDTAIDILSKIGIPNSEQRLKQYPHQLSGGMRQRIMIAMALACNPKLMIADEPTTALDVTIQAQIMDLLKKLNNDFGTALILITHDLGVVAEMCQRIVVMYAGKVVEEADVNSIFNEPLHPYTIGLLKSIPRVKYPKEKLFVIEGNVPNPFSMPSGCYFHPRCFEVMPVCREEDPQFLEAEAKHFVKCWKYN